MKIKNIGTIDYSSFDHEAAVSVSIPVGESVEVSDKFGEYLLGDDSPGTFEKAKAEKAAK